MGAERALAKTIGGFCDQYQLGISLERFLRDFDRAQSLAGQMTGNARSEAPLISIRAVLEATNAELRRHEAELNLLLTDAAAKIGTQLATLATVHAEYDAGLGLTIAELQKVGLSGSVAELAKIIEQRGGLVAALSRLDQHRLGLDRLRGERSALLTELRQVREQKTKRRKELIRLINRHLARAIDDYSGLVL